MGPRPDDLLTPRVNAIRDLLARENGPCSHAAVKLAVTQVGNTSTGATHAFARLLLQASKIPNHAEPMLRLGALARLARRLTRS
jgi:hypothetical protein